MRRSAVIAILVFCAAALSAQEPLQKARGFRADQVYELNGIDTINVFTGNLNLTLPLGQSFPVGPGLSYGFVLRYTGNLWQMSDEHCEKRPADGQDHCGIRYFPNRDNAGLGWGLSFGTLRAPDSNPSAGAPDATLRWLYRSPDGAEHYFFDVLHEPACTATLTTNCDPVDSNTFYTRDSTYLRLKITGDLRIIEFPDGTRHRFETAPNGDWRLRYIYDAHSTFLDGAPNTNYVRIDYVPNAANATIDDWEIHDSHGRVHRVVFFKPVFESGVTAIVTLVDRVEIAKTGGGTATYNLQYGINTNGESYNETSHPPGAYNYDTPIRAWLLRSVTAPAPNNSVYSFNYDIRPVEAPDDRSGTLIQMTLPTLGKVNWTYQTVSYPEQTAAGALVGVDSRSVTDALGNELEYTHYALNADGSRITERQVPIPNTNPVQRWTAQKTQSWFRVESTPSEFGLPFTRQTNTPFSNPSNGHYLSSATYDCAQDGTCTAKQVNYVKYEMDSQGSCTVALCNTNRARRVFSERTIYPSDSNRTADVEHSQYDGLGHYRRHSTTGGYESGNIREEYKDYNPSLSPYWLDANGNRGAGYSMLPASSPWVLTTSTYSYTLENGKMARTEQHFDATTGDLLRQRTVRPLVDDTRGAHDLVNVFVHEGGTGFVTQYDQYGGDDGGQTLTQPYASLPDLPLPAGPDYRTKYTYKWGGLETAQNFFGNSPMPFEAFHNVIDMSTGLITESRDASGHSTVYTYDTTGRLTSEAPAGLAATNYTYSNAYVSGSTYVPAEVSITSNSSMQSGTKQTIHRFDAFGRPWRELRLLPTGQYGVGETLYDALGHKKSVSEWGVDNPSAYKSTFDGYDWLGRAATITGPDNKTTTFAYTGNRVTTRTRGILTDAGVHNVVVTEVVDRAGRLIHVTENATGSNPITTNYTYDVGNRLETVTTNGAAQLRTFTYDGAGFLMQEIQPESGTTSYEYDSRGHVMTKIAPNATVRSMFDPAGRLQMVTQDEVGVLVENVYDRPNSGNDLSMGKLAYAIRHNRNTTLGADVTVKETFTYAGPAGAVTKKKTEISSGETFTDQYSYDDFGNVKTVTYPTCQGCSLSTEPSRTVAYTFDNGSTRTVGGYARDIDYHPNGMLNNVRHVRADGVNGPLLTQTLQNASRPEKIEVTNYCDDLLITVQPSSTSMSVTATGASAFQWYERTAAGDALIAGQTTNTMTAPLAGKTYWVHVANGTCTLDSQTATYSNCSAPATISAPSSMFAGATASASVASTSGATYSWSIANGTIASGQGTNAITFQSNCAGATTGLSVSVTASCGTITNDTKNVALSPVTATVLPASGSTIQANLTGIAPWSVTWSDNVTQSNIQSSPATRTVTPSATTTYTITAVSDAHCSGTSSGSATVTVVPPAPIGLIATATSSTQVSLTWSVSGSYDSFEIERRTGMSWSSAGTSTTTSFAEITATGTAYLYRVRTVRSGTASSWSNVDLATTVMFSDDPVIANVTAVKFAHLTELRTAINAVRTLAGLGTFTFSGSAGVGAAIDGTHVQELRTALDPARSTLGLAPLTYTDQPLAALVVVKAVHMNEIRGGVK